MDKIKFSSIESTKLLSEIKRVVVVLMLITANDSHSAAMETTNGPSSAVSSPQKSQPTIKPAMALVSACLLTALFLICFLFFYFRRYPERQLALAAATGSGGDRSLLKLATAPGLDPAVIAAFTTFTYSAVKEIKIGQQVLECAVCLNEFYDHETLRLLPECCHVFHRECIDEWLALHVTCPVCRANLVPKPGQLSMTESCFDQNESTEDHVTVEVINLKHGGRRFSRSYSAGHSAAGRQFENVERYTLRLPDELQNALKNSVIKKPADYVGEISLKKCVRSASANYVRESSYFAYERFGQERLRLEDKV